MVLERCRGNFAVAYDKASGKIATARQYMQERIKQGVNSDVCNEGAWTSENFNCIQGNIYGCLAEFNPLIPYKEQAVKAHRNGNEFYLIDNVLLSGNVASEVILETAEQDKAKPDYKKRVINLEKAQTHDVPTDSFADDKGIAFLARGKSFANKYGLFLRNKAGIQQVTFYLPGIQSKDYSRGFWLCRIGHGNRSDFSGYYGFLDSDYGSVFRVRGKKSAEGTQKISPEEIKVLPYTEEQLDLYLETAKGIKEGKLGSLQAGKLEELVLGLKQFLKQ